MEITTIIAAACSAVVFLAWFVLPHEVERPAASEAALPEIPMALPAPPETVAA